MVDGSMGYVYRPSTFDGVRDVLETARQHGRSLCLRGSGYSYGDTALNAENMVLDITRMNRVLDWRSNTGLIRVEPGVTIRDLWRYVLEDGWWPAVVPGAMYPTVGGCTAVNAHGKNNWWAGGFADHVLGLELMLVSGDVVACSPHENSDLFWAAVGSLGVLGVITSVTLQLHQVTSGLLRIEEIAVPSLDAMFDAFEARLTAADYLVGWIDAFASGSELGRGLVQIANYVDDDPDPHTTLRPSYQDLGDTVLGVIPRSILWLGMKPLVNDTGMRLLNEARYRMGQVRAGRQQYLPHAQFHFFHDFVPKWKRSFQPIGIIQYQVFVPEAQARVVFASLLEGAQRAGLYPYLTVFKRHRRDESLLSYGVDGYSLSLDFRATPNNQRRLREMLDRFTQDTVLPACGRFYPAKDTVLDHQTARQSFGADAVDRFMALKREMDPGEMLQSDMYRRLLSGPSL
jgi:decaprenylphospho-beta-D-ribofuranose 2-oxidase